MARCGLWTSFALGWMGSVCRVFEATEVSRTIPLAAEKAVSLLRLGGGSNIDDFPALQRVEMTKPSEFSQTQWNGSKPRVLPKLSGRRRALKFDCFRSRSSDPGKRTDEVVGTLEDQARCLQDRFLASCRYGPLLGWEGREVLGESQMGEDG